MLHHSSSKLVAAGLALFAASAGVHAAQIAYPTKPIRLIVPFPPGGSADPLARAFGTWFSDNFGVPVVSDNRPGAGTAIAHTLAARAAPDGYTLLLGASSGLISNPASGLKLDYDPVKDFAPVGFAAYVPQLLVVHPSVPARSLSELIALAKAQPGKINFGSYGVGSLGHLSIELLNSTARDKFVHVPYKGVAPATIDLFGGRIQAVFGSVTGTRPHVLAGKIRAIATGHRERLRAMPELPTIGETLPGFTNDGWYGIVAPAGTPLPIVEKLNGQMKRALTDAAFTKYIDTIGMLPGSGSPQELGAWIRSELARWKKVVRDAGINLGKK